MTLEILKKSKIILVTLQKLSFKILIITEKLPKPAKFLLICAEGVGIFGASHLKNI